MIKDQGPSVCCLHFHKSLVYRPRPEARLKARGAPARDRPGTETLGCLGSTDAIFGSTGRWRSFSLLDGLAFRDSRALASSESETRDA